MAIGALLNNQWKGAFGGEYGKNSSKGTKSAMQWFAETAPGLLNPGKEDSGDKTALQPNAPLSYSRRITASFKTEEFHASQSKNGETIYSYHASRQQFEVVINVNGDNRNYAIKGIDKEGNAFEKEFDPYEVDPENADYTEFTALCLYIQRTDGYADSLMGDFGQSLDETGDFNILEKRNYVSIFGKWGTWQAKGGDPEFYSGAMEMLGAIHRFMEDRLGKMGAGEEASVSEELIDLLFKEQDTEAVKAEEYKKTGYTKAVFSGSEPEKPGKVFYTYYSPESIRCMKEGERNPENPEEKIGEDTLAWEMKFGNEEQYQQVMKFLSQFPEEDNFLFASKEEFWDDFLNGKVDTDGFMKFYQWTEHGVPNLGVSIDGEQGRFSREKITDPNAKYFNDQSWIGHVWTEEEMWAQWHAKIGAANPAASAGQNKSTVNNYWEREFDQIGKNAPQSVKKAWMDAAAAVGADGMGIAGNGMMDHISQLMVQRLIKIYRGEKADNILGSSVQSAIMAVDNALYDLEHPLDGNHGRTPEQMRNREREKKFYQEFLQRLHSLTV